MPVVFSPPLCQNDVCSREQPRFSSAFYLLLLILFEAVNARWLFLHWRRFFLPKDSFLPPALHIVFPLLRKIALGLFPPCNNRLSCEPHRAKCIIASVAKQYLLSQRIKKRFSRFLRKTFFENVGRNDLPFC